MQFRSHVFIHKCSVTIPIERQYWDVATENLNDACHWDGSLSFWRGGGECEKFRIYRFAWRLKIRSSPRPNEKCHIQAYPTVGPTAFMRLDWNPAEAGAYATREILDFLSRYVPGLMDAWPDAMITRVDVTFDVTGLSIKEVYVFTKSLKTQQKPFNENRGCLNAIYLGVPKSERRLALYDKRHEQLGEGVRFARPRATGRPPYLPRSRTRFEFRFLRIGTISDIPTFSNGLSRYFVALAYKAKCLNGGKSWKIFIGQCDRLCAQDAFHFVADRKRRAFYRRLLEKHCAPDWYCRQTLWQEAKESMMQALWIQ